MSIELSLLPMQLGLGSGLSHEILRAGAGYELFEALKKLNQKDVGPIRTYVSPAIEEGEVGYGRTEEDAYGAPLKYVTAEELLPVAEKFFLPSATGFLKGLNPNVPVVLYWH
jgi:hypothetical protein